MDETLLDRHELMRDEDDHNCSLDNLYDEGPNPDDQYEDYVNEQMEREN